MYTTDLQCTVVAIMRQVLRCTSSSIDSTSCSVNVNRKSGSHHLPKAAVNNGFATEDSQ